MYEILKKLGFLLPVVCLTVVLGGCQDKGNDVVDGVNTNESEIRQEAQINASDNVEENNESAISKERTGDNASINESEIMAYITDFDDDNISVDAIEWITVSSSRADELGIKEEDAPNGFYIYNPDTLIEQFTLSANCIITILDWQNSYEPQTIPVEKFVAILQERREQNNFIPYSFKVTDSTITEISEHYVP